MRLKKIQLFILSGIIISAAFLFTQSALAENSREPLLKIFNPITLEVNLEYLVFDQAFQGGGTVAVGDLGGDGINEIIVGAGTGGGPQVRIFRQDGSAIKSFFAYPTDFRGGIEVATGDLNGDGSDEIITVPGFAGGPQVRIFDGYGDSKFNPGFYPFDPEYKGGIHVAVCDVDGNGEKEIVVGTGANSQPHVRVFNRYGLYTGMDFRPFSDSEKGGVSVACANVDGGLEEEIIMGINSYGSSWIKVYKTNAIKTILGSFYAFGEAFKGGVNVAGGDVDGDGLDEVVVAANSGGGPQIRAFEAYGKELAINFFAYEDNFTGGVAVATGNVHGSKKAEIITLPKKKAAEGRTDLYNYIEINLSAQRLTYYENGYKVLEYPISSGKSGMDTPIGEYKILSKTPLAYSSPYALWMPNWMGFTQKGHGIHGLPFWRLKGGGVYYEGEDHLGRKVSHGCVRLPVAGSKELFDRVEVGTPVIIY